jgi:hypothetical protein
LTVVQVPAGFQPPNAPIHLFSIQFSSEETVS